MTGPKAFDDSIKAMVNLFKAKPIQGNVHRCFELANKNFLGAAIGDT